MLSNATAIIAFSNFHNCFFFFIKVLHNKFLCYTFPITLRRSLFTAKLIRDEW